MAEPKTSGILLVCTGNMARSPLGEAMLRALMRAHGLDGTAEVSSAGTGTRFGIAPTAEAAAVAAEMGLDLSGHSSHPLDENLIAGNDLILVMERIHKDYVARVFPGAAGKTFTLGEYAGTGEEIPDPYGGGMQLYRACAHKLDALLIMALARMKREGILSAGSGE